MSFHTFATLFPAGAPLGTAVTAPGTYTYRLDPVAFALSGIMSYQVTGDPVPHAIRN